MNRSQRRAEKMRFAKIKPKVFDFTGTNFPNIKDANGNAQSGCYASVLQNCSGGITREHYISENLLNRF